MKDFEDEDPTWVQAYLAAAHGAMTYCSTVDASKAVQIATTFADKTIALLASRAVVRRETDEATKAERRRAQNAGAALAQEVGCYADERGDLLDYRECANSHVVLVYKNGILRQFPVLAFVDAEELSSEYGLRPAPEHCRTEVRTKARLAHHLAVPFGDVELTWDEFTGKPLVVDVQVRGLRPTRLMWEGLEAVCSGLLAPYATASVLWG